jgi:TusA-related sulfurtransferase
MSSVLQKQSENAYILDCRKLSEKMTQVYTKKVLDRLKAGFYLKILTKGPSCDECFGIMGLCEGGKCELINVTNEKGIYTYEVLKN